MLALALADAARLVVALTVRVPLAVRLSVAETDVAAAVVEAAVSTVAVVDDTAVSAAETSAAAAETASTVAAVVEVADSVVVAATLSTPASVSAVGPQPIRSALRRLTTANLFIQITFLLLLLVMPFNLGLTHHILM
jgi:hypothetical protein